MFDGDPTEFSQIPTGGNQASGRLGELQLIVQSQPMRADLILNPASPPTQEAPSGIDDLDAAVQLGSDVAAKMICAEAAQRVAMVVNLAEQLTDAGEVIARLQAEVGPLPTPPAIEELQFSFNQRRTSRIAGRDLMHIARWVQGRRSFFQIDFTRLPAPPLVTQQVDVFSRYIDVASLNDMPVSAVDAAGVFAEIADQVKGSASQGYGFYEHI